MQEARVIDIPKMPSVADMVGDMEVPDLGPHPALETNEQLKKLNETSKKMLEQLTRIQSWLVKIEGNTRKSSFRA